MSELLKYIAISDDGTVIHIPQNIEVKEPIFTSDIKHSALTIILEPYSSAIVIDETKRSADSKRNFHIKEGAKLHYSHVQNCDDSIAYTESQMARVDKDASFHSVHVGLGAKSSSSNIQTVLDASGANAKLLGVFFGDDQQSFDMHTLQEHKSADTQSDLLFKSALKGHAKSFYEGTICVPKQAQRSDAVQTNRNLLLSNHARAKSIPKLEIIADDVQCKHAATMGTLDSEEVFYLESRGLNNAEAEQMIVEGFFEQVLSKIPSENVRVRLTENIQQKLQS
jgi:Fe-S cluster assembly protein SufD